MKDDRASEENLMDELDRMYRHVADIESCQAEVEHDPNPDEPEQMSGQETTTHAKVIPFPRHRIHLPPRKPTGASKKEPRRKRKHSYRTYLIVASLTLIFLAFVWVILPVNVITGSQDSEKGEPPPSMFPIQSQPSSPVRKGEDVLQNTGERQGPAEAMPQQAVPSKSASNQTTETKFAFATTKHYAVQIGAFHNWENASGCMEALQIKNLEPYWVEIQGESRRIIYLVFSGHFADRHEAAEFLERKGILRNYPDSYVREISF